MFEIFEITARYSNAVLVAIMPCVSDFAKRLDLPVPQPITLSQVREFKCSPRSDLFGGRVILTNGHEFAFLHGRVEMYRTPQSYYELQDPDRVPEFFGPVKLKEEDALRVVHQAIKKLGYTDARLYADRLPRITRPARFGKNYVPRFRIWWGDPSWGNPDDPPASVEFEVDATTGQIQMMYLLNVGTRRDSPKVDVHPRVIGKGPQTVTVGQGRQVTPVNPAYANAFLSAILPQFSDYVGKAGFPIPLPITTNDVNMARYDCGVVEGDPRVFLHLKTGERFVYSHGQVVAFYASDVMQLPGGEDKPIQQFFGPVNITGNQAIALVRQTIKRLGYSQTVLHADESPQVGAPARYGTNTIARYFLNWKESRYGPFRVCAEVDARTKTIKSLYINDHAITNIWREPPKIDISPDQMMPGDERPQRPTGSGDKPPPRL